LLCGDSFVCGDFWECRLLCVATLLCVPTFVCGDIRECSRYYGTMCCRCVAAAMVTVVLLVVVVVVVCMIPRYLFMAPIVHTNELDKDIYARGRVFFFFFFFLGLIYFLGVMCVRLMVRVRFNATQCSLLNSCFSLTIR
jgi:hypothetical protein